MRWEHYLPSPEANGGKYFARHYEASVQEIPTETPS